MKKAVLVLLAYWCVGGAASDLTWNHGLQPASDKGLAQAYEQLVTAGAAHGRPVGPLEITRPGFKLVIQKGAIYQEDAPLLGGAHGFAFVGEATIDFGVTDPVERAHFEKFTGLPEWKALPVTTVYLLPTGPVDPFEGPFGEESRSEPAWSGLKNALHWDGFETLAELANRRSRKAPDILILFETGKNIWCYREDSERDEEVALLRLGRPPEREARWWDPVVSLHLSNAGELTSVTTSADVASKERLDLNHVEMNLSVLASGETTARATLTMSPLKEGPAVVLYLTPMLVVKSVRTAQGRELPFLQADYSKAHEIEEAGVVTVLPEGTAFPDTLTVDYAGPLFEPTGNSWFLCKEEDLWYPRVEDIDGASYDTTVAVPEKFEAITIGQRVKRTVSDGQAVYQYRFADKAMLSTLAVGSFRHHKDTSGGLDLDVAFPDSVYTAQVQTQEEAILTIVSNCIKIDQKLYGPQRYSRLTVTQCSFGHGRGFPTLLLLSALMPAFAAGPYRFELDHALVSHETAHQWWGNIVEPLTYRDAWISEGMAQLASLDYAMVVFGPQKVKDALDSYRFNLDGLLAYSRKPAWQEGPICLGSRLATTLEPRGAYQTIVYDKAAWAMANLREVARLAPPGGSIQPFYDALQDFLRTYGGRKASTQDFQKVMERHYKMSLDWFFDQYFRRAQIPTAAVKARAEEAGGAWKLVAEGTQDTDFRLAIPIQVMYGDKTGNVVFILDGRQGRQEIPLQGKPSSIKVDPYHYALARVKS